LKINQTIKRAVHRNSTGGNILTPARVRARDGAGIETAGISADTAPRVGSFFTRIRACERGRTTWKNLYRRSARRLCARRDAAIVCTSTFGGL